MLNELPSMLYVKDILSYRFSTFFTTFCLPFDSKKSSNLKCLNPRRLLDKYCFVNEIKTANYLPYFNKGFSNCRTKCSML